ncbi:hypothetical protein [Flavobacterium cerinum]|uniref:Carboxypeptidase-like regulatory domain-containing protein n=1 Tax=Flavobacterium cerinum TaxID=2502784 RepID=A0A3S3Q814_9FLAO|nr:hypothetical protein [Flavobacterium cerinum]RWW92304.1 hypothetical protein EPI11_15440 [Flavobacterium cerinum]
MNKFFLFLFTLSPIIVLCQERQLLKGKAISDRITAQNLIVKNKTANITTVTDNEGNFTIEAGVNDVLEFSSEIFKTLEHVLNSRDFKEELFVVRVVPSSIMLDEVVLTGLTGNLAIDSKNTKVMLLNHLFDPAEINKNVVPSNPSGNINFMSILGMAANAIRPKPKSIEDIYKNVSSVEHRSFSKIVQENFPESFFTETVGIPKAKLGLFLNFCNAEAKRYLLDPKNKEELIAYLKKKYIQYQYQK